MFRELFPEAARTGWRQVEESVPDVLAGPLWCECKVGRRTYPQAALAQAAANCMPGRWPAAICKDDRTRPTATMYLDDLLDLLGEWKERGQ